MVLDGEIVELKTVSGTRATLSKDFKKGYKQGASLAKSHNIGSHSVFIRLFSELPVESVRAKIAGELKERLDDGFVICYFEANGRLGEQGFLGLLPAAALSSGIFNATATHWQSQEGNAGETPVYQCWSSAQGILDIGVCQRQTPIVPLVIAACGMG